jgi:zinc and cadmium transporter
MTASPTVLLLIYCTAIAGFSLAGGMLPNWVRMTHTRTQVVMSFVSGFMLSVAFYHLLPHSVALAPGPGAMEFAVWWLMVGLIAILLLLRLFHFHQHDFSREEEGRHDHPHPHADEVPDHALSWVGIALGLGLHTLIDGVALGAVMLGAAAIDDGSGLLGVGVFLAILLHKPLDAMSISTIMAVGGWTPRARHVTNLLFAMMCPFGALLFYFGINLLAGQHNVVVAGALAISAGAFICIALSDLLPEVHFHSHDRLVLTLAFLLGIVLAYSLGSVEPASLHPGNH